MILIIKASTDIKNKFPFPFDFQAIHIDNGFAPIEERTFVKKELSRYCDEMKIPLTIHELPMEEIWSEKENESPCFICARYRRGALARLAKEAGFNKLALAHHQDDAVETLMMSLFNSGQIRTFTPCSYMDRSEITVIRPLVFLREEEVVEAVDQLPWEPLKNPCPHNSSTKRSEMRTWLLQQETNFPGLFDKLSRSLRKDQVKELWPALPDREELKQKFEKFWDKPSKQ